MYLFAFLGVDLKFAVSVWAYFRLNHHRIQQTALHSLVLYLQENLDFYSSHPFLSFVTIQVYIRSSSMGQTRKNEWTESTGFLLLLKDIVEMKKKSHALAFPSQLSMHVNPTAPHVRFLPR